MKKLKVLSIVLLLSCVQIHAADEAVKANNSAVSPAADFEMVPSGKSERKGLTEERKQELMSAPGIHIQERAVNQWKARKAKADETILKQLDFIAKEPTAGHIAPEFEEVTKGEPDDRNKNCCERTRDSFISVVTRLRIMVREGVAKPKVD